MKQYSSHGSGRFTVDQFCAIGQNVIFEEGVLVFHPENIELADNIYVGHQTILKGYHQNQLVIGSDTWIGQQCFLHSAGGLIIGSRVGIGPGVRILTSTHHEPGGGLAIMAGTLDFAPVMIGDGSDLGVGAILLPGVNIGKGVQVGAGAVVSRDVPDRSVVAGVPARVIRMR